MNFPGFLKTLLDYENSEFLMFNDGSILSNSGFSHFDFLRSIKKESHKIL